MAELARTVAAPRGVDEVLSDVTATAKEIIPDADTAGVLLLAKGGKFDSLAATDDLPPDDFVFYASVLLGDADRAVRVVHDLERGTDVMDNVIWWDLARPMRQTAEFRRLVGAVGLEQLWRVRGWPDKCRPKGAGDFVCD